MHLEKIENGQVMDCGGKVSFKGINNQTSNLPPKHISIIAPLQFKGSSQDIPSPKERFKISVISFVSEFVLSIKHAEINCAYSTSRFRSNFVNKRT